MQIFNLLKIIISHGLMDHNKGELNQFIESPCKVTVFKPNSI